MSVLRLALRIIAGHSFLRHYTPSGGRIAISMFPQFRHRRISIDTLRYFSTASYRQGSSSYFPFGRMESPGGNLHFFDMACSLSFLWRGRGSRKVVVPDIPLADAKITGLLVEKARRVPTIRAALQGL